MAFNGEGANGIYKPDTLTPAVKKYASDFHFVSHTWNHPTLDVPYTFAQTATQVLYNDAMALKLKLPVDFRNLVTPNVSGLRNPEALRAMVATGVRYVVTDTSQPGYGNPTPNTGLWNEFQPKLFMIPRYPTNLYFNVSTPAEWAPEYNCMYAGYWGRNLTYEEILGNISDTMVTYLLKGDLNPRDVPSAESAGLRRQALAARRSDRHDPGQVPGAGHFPGALPDDARGRRQDDCAAAPTTRRA